MSLFDPKAPDRGYAGPSPIRPAVEFSDDDPEMYGEEPEDEGVRETLINDQTMLALVRDFQRIARDYQSRAIEQPLSRSYRAWHNEHGVGSKYLNPTWSRGRSALFVPKTKSAVRKNIATAAGALFSTEDVVNISANFSDDQVQRATAAVLKADLDYRLTSNSQIYGTPWFIMAMGACLDSQLTGVCISKQSWEYIEVETDEIEEIVVPTHAVDEGGDDLFDEVTGEPVMVDMVEERLKMRVVRDRPMCELHPIENVLLDPAAPWYSPAQLGRALVVRHPMGLEDARAFLRSKLVGTGHVRWRTNVRDEDLLKGRNDEERTSGTRSSRDGGSDRYGESRGAGGLDIVWLQENFIRIGNRDYNFWSVGDSVLLSDIDETYRTYPEFGGERPYHMGVAGVETHRVFPMSPVESWRPLQLELNDIVNLRQDTLKRSIAPLPIVKTGANVDVGALQRRGAPETVVFAHDVNNDIKFHNTPGPSGQSYTETSQINASFDELAGVFSTSSVQSSRQLNETVGGMSLMSRAANSVTEFDLRVWVETWVEPVMRQFLQLIRYYETDEHMLLVAGQKARVLAKFNYAPTFDDIQTCDVTLKVSVGIGALDPMQRLAKLKVALDTLAPLYQEMKAQGITLDLEAIIEEVMGAAGYKDGRRFFKFGAPPEQQANPEVELAAQELALKKQEIEASFKSDLEKLRQEMLTAQLEAKTKLQIEDKKAQTAIVTELIEALDRREQRDFDQSMGREERAFQHVAQRANTDSQRQHETQQTKAQQQFQREERTASHERDRERETADREAAREALAAKTAAAGGKAPAGKKAASKPAKASAPRPEAQSAGDMAERAFAASDEIERTGTGEAVADQLNQNFDAALEAGKAEEQLLRIIQNFMAKPATPSSAPAAPQIAGPPARPVPRKSRPKGR